MALVAAALGLAGCGSTPDVVVARAGPATLTAEPGGVGTVAPAVSIPVSVDIRDDITNVDVQPGDHVVKGQPLFNLDPTPLQQSLAELTLKLQNIEASIADAQSSLASHQAKNPASVPSIQANIQALQGEATVEQQLIAIAQGTTPTITAPADGDVETVNATAGLQATPGQPLVVIIDYTNISVTANLPIVDQGQVTPGANALLSFPSLPDVNLRGTVTGVSPAATNNGVTFQITVAAPNTQSKQVRPNVQAYVRVSVTHDATVAVSKLAVVNIDVNPVVFVVDGQVAHMRQVRIGITDGNDVEILDGVHTGDLCVIVGNQTLQDGTSVRVTKVEG